MVKKPTRHEETPTQPESITHPPMPQGRDVPPVPSALAQDPNAVAVITAQLALIEAQITYATELQGQLPVDGSTLPPTAATQPIIDTLAGVSRALGAEISQLESLQALWPPAAMQAGVNGNGGTP